jgi:hypothetical protein
MPGSALLFQVLLDNGVLRDKLPISAIVHKESAPDLPFHYLQLWNCFSYAVHIAEVKFISGMRCSVLMKDKKWYDGQYLFSFNWSGESVLGSDFSWAEEPSEHKSGHFVELDNGCYAIQPNNRMRFYEPSFVVKEFPERPDYKVCTHSYNCEHGDKWVTEDSDKYMYDTEQK